MPRTAWLYYLCEPDTGEVRYVGWTTKPPKQRLWHHTSEARHGGGAYRGRWIRSLFSRGTGPTIRAIALVSVIDAPAMEIFLIAAHRHIGARLVNTTNGGDGTLGCIPSKETRDKISQAKRGTVVSLETREKLSASHMGIHPSLETRARQSAARRGKKRTAEFCTQASARMQGEKHPLWGKHHSPKTLAKMSAAHRGEKNHFWGKHHSPETCAKISVTKRAVSLA